MAIIVNGKVVDKYGDEALEYVDLLSLADDYGATLILEWEDKAVIARGALGVGIIIVVRSEGLGMGLLTIDRLASELAGLGTDQPFEEVTI